MEAEEKLGLMCFMDDTRECNASCMAYITHPAGCGPELVEMQSHCIFITGVERIARHTTIIASLLSDGEKKRRIAEADRQRAQAVQPSVGIYESPFPKKDKTF